MSTHRSTLAATVIEPEDSDNLIDEAVRSLTDAGDLLEEALDALAKAPPEVLAAWQLRIAALDRALDRLDGQAVIQ